VLLVRLSTDMTGNVSTGRGEWRSLVVTQQLVDELLQGLVDTLASGYPIGHWDVAVLGYRTAPDGSPQLLSLLADDRPKPRWVSLAELAARHATPREVHGQPHHWAAFPAAEGEPCPAMALAEVYQLVSVWLTGRYTARPPVVIHCTATAGFDRDYFRIARSLGLLTTGYGPVRLLHYLFDTNNDEALAARLLGVSAELPGNPETGTLPRRGVWVNDWDIRDPWEALFCGSWQESATLWSEPTEPLPLVHTFHTAKLGNTPEQWEDAVVVDPARATAAIADGASSGIFCRLWAQQLCERFIHDRPNVRDPTALNQWVNQLRHEWRTAINYKNLNWSKKAKVDEVGAAATLLGWELGPVAANGQRRWRACAIGDACLFWVRDNQLLATFPVVAANQLGSTPLLVRSNPGFRTLALAAEGTCEPGDRFLLATDAVAARFFQTLTETEPDWRRYETLEPAVWLAEVDELRSRRQMVNDDCTLVVLSVGDGVTQESQGPTTSAPSATEATGVSDPSADGSASRPSPTTPLNEPGP
jgi:hypothetical protein